MTSYPGYDDLEEAKRLGYRIEDISEQSMGENDQNIVSSHDLPIDIKDVDDSILDKIIFDEEHKKRFRITRHELEFYRKHNLSLPRVHPVIRMAQWRLNFDLRLRFFERACARCGKMMQTTFAPDRPEKNIWCDECYANQFL